MKQLRAWQNKMVQQQVQGTHLVALGLALPLMVMGCFDTKPQGSALSYRASAFSGAFSGKSMAPAANINGAAVATVTPEVGANISTANASGSALFKRVAVGIPPGALAIATSITVEEATPVVNAATSEALGLKTLQPAGPSVAVTADNMNALTGTLAISFPYGSQANLQGFTEQLVVIGLYPVGSGFQAETFVGNELLFEENAIKVNVSKFGAYQVAKVRETVVKKSQPTNAGFIPAKRALDMGVGQHVTFFISSQSQLPECNPARIANLFYIRENNSFFTCDGSKWAEVVIKGEKGERGDKGEQGVAGAQGAQGATGAKGDKGDQGVAGQNGVNGTSAESGPKLYQAGTANFWAYLKGSAPYHWGEFKEGFFSLLESAGSAGSFRPKREPVYYSTRDCAGSTYLSNALGYNHRQLFYTQVGPDPMVATTAQSLKIAPLSIRRPGEGCHNLAYMGQVGMTQISTGMGYDAKIFAEFKGYLYYTLRHPTEGRELFRHHLATNQSSLFHSFISGYGDLEINEARLSPDGQRLAFRTYSYSPSMEYKVWVTDGTNAPTALETQASWLEFSWHSHDKLLVKLSGNPEILKIHNLQDMTATNLTTSTSINLSNAKTFGSRTCFTAHINSTTDFELMCTDGSNILSYDLNNNSSVSSEINGIYEGGGSFIYLTAKDVGGVRRLWRYDGSGAPTVVSLPEELSSMYFNSNSALFYHGYLYIAPGQSSNIYRVASDGSVATTNPSGLTYHSPDFFLAGDKMFMKHNSNSFAVCSSPAVGTPCSWQNVVNKNELSAMPNQYAALGGKVFFWNNYKLWITDGTELGTVGYPYGSQSGSNDSAPFRAGNGIYFMANGQMGYHLAAYFEGTDASDNNMMDRPESYLHVAPLTGFNPVAIGNQLQVMP